jgi:flagellar hook-associated protein 1 FlgK
MTIPSFTGYQTALSGLEAAQAAINTTGENISNANTAGYTRQVVNTAESNSLPIQQRSASGAQAQLGTGVDITSISRIRNQFLDVQYRAQNSQTSAANANSSSLQQVQTAVNEPSTTGVSAGLSTFYSDWSALATNPTSQAAQQSVVSDGQSLVSTLNSTYAQMQTVQQQAGAQLTNMTSVPNGQVAQNLTQLATLNGQIIAATQGGQSPNELLDQRDNLLDSLSGMAQISVTADSNNDGGVVVALANAPTTPLVSGTTVNWPQTVSASTGGQLGALASLSDTSSAGTIQPYLDSLSKVASQVTTAVNALQSPTSPFFSGILGGTGPAGSATGALQVTATAATIQSSSSSTSGPDLAQSIANLKGGAADQSFSAFVAQIGSGVQSAQSTQSTAQSVLTAVGNQRQSVSGVSLDEEMTNLINYQQAYQASARVMNAIDSALNTLITTVGAGL